VWTIAEDPVRRKLFTASEYFSHYAVIDQDGGGLTTPGTISNSTWPFWHFTADPARRVLYATSALYDGALHEMDLDSYRFRRTATDLYLYETILDAERHLLWGVRPITGEVIAVDTRSYELRHRIPVQFGMRDLQRDSTSGDMYTCSEFFGDVFRIDGQTLSPTRIGWCGRLCRGMFLDAERNMLWVATRDGVCRVPTR
jgi:hypothetical protein